MFVRYKKIIHVLNWTYGLFGWNYRVALLFTLYLTEKRNNFNQQVYSNMPKLTKIANCLVRTDGLILIREKISFEKVFTSLLDILLLGTFMIYI